MSDFSIRHPILSLIVVGLLVSVVVGEIIMMVYVLLQWLM